MYVEGRIIAKLKPGITRDDIIKIIPSAELQDIAGGFVVITFEDLPVIDEVQVLKDSGLVEHAQPDNIYELTLEPYVPNDNQFTNQWALENSGSNGGVGGVAGEDIDAPMAWALLLGNAYSVGSPGCKVAVIDTGCQHRHPDLSQNVAFADGIDFFNGDYDSLDDNGHGTHVTGIIAAKGDNGTGIAGVAWNCRVYSIKVLGASMQTTDTLLLYAIDHIDFIQAKIVNLSLASHSYSQALYNAMNAKTDVLFVCGAGNSGTDNDTDPWFPASFDMPNVISVANTNHKGELNAYSNYGATSVDVAAPGSNCLSTYPTDDYVWLSGTSMAAPYVTGLAVLLKSVSPTLTPAQMKTLIMSTGEALPALAGKTVSGKRINAYNALSQLLSPPPIPTKMIKQSGITDVPDDDKLYCRQNGIWVQKTDDYALPVATITTLGGVIIGANLKINEAGVLSGDAEPYVLLPATETTLGGVKKGSNITIAEDGTISATSPDSNNLGYYADETALTSAHPTANPGNYAFNYDTNTIWVWDADLVDWKDTFRKSFSVEPLEPTKDCLMQWHDSNGSYAKSATTNAYVQNGLFVKIPHSSGKGKYKIKTYGDIYTESYGGIVDLNPYCNAFYNDWPGLGFVCNMIDGVNNSRFGGGLLICGHDYYEWMDITNQVHNVKTPRVALAIKPAGGGVMEALYITKDGVVHCDYGIAMTSVNIAAGQTYNINGVPHAHSQYLPLTGGNLSGSISLGLNRITNVANPVDGKDAVNVDYVSGIVAGIIWQLPVDSITATTPSSPIEGERHIVGVGATGVFAEHDMQIATYTDGVWEFQVASAGWSVSNKADNFAYNYNGAAWAQMPGAVTHGALSGLGGDDHSQYVHKDVARTITAQHSFTHSGAPFLVTSNTLVNNLNSKYLDGAVKTDFAATVHQHSISDITSVLLTNVLDGQILKYDSASGKFINVEDIGALAINPKHQFADETERDAYFAAFPSELEDGTLISLGDGFQMYDGEPDPYNIAFWKNKTAVVKGPPGINGTNGIDGKDGVSGQQGIQGPQGPQGVAGAQGPAGSPGTSINLKGSVATEADLAEIENPTLNDGYYCEADGDCYIWSGTAWVDCGPIVGPTGPQGVQGIQGVAGTNGSQGPIGLTGPAGPNGDQGSIGPRGPASFVNPYYQQAVEDMVPEPPAVFDKGDRFIVSGTPTPLGPWDGHANDIATAVEGEEGLVWFFEDPSIGWAVYDLGSVVHRAWNGSEWKRWESTSGVWGGVTGNISEQEDLQDALGTKVNAPESTTENKVPQWDSTTKTLKDGLVVGTAANNLVQLNGDGKLPALDGSLLTDLVASFTDLTDVPQEYVEADAGKAVVVNAAHNGLEFGTVAKKFVELTDAPQAFVEADAGKAVIVNQTYNGLEFGTVATKFTELTDAPNAFVAGDAGKVVRVNATYNGLEFYTPASGSVTDDTIWDAAGDLAVGLGSNSAARLPMGTRLQHLRVNDDATGLEYADPVSEAGMFLIQRAIEGVVSPSYLMYWIAPASCNIMLNKAGLFTMPNVTGSYMQLQVMKNGTNENNSIFTNDTPIQIVETTPAVNGIYQASGTLDSGQVSLAAGDVLYFRINRADTGCTGLLLQVGVVFT